MTTPVFPPIPPVPADTADAATWERYRWAVTENNRAALAAAQAATAVAMTAMVAAQDRASQALLQMPTPAWTKPALTLWCLDRLPEMTGLTDLARTDLAVKQAEALLSRLPPA